MTIEERYEEAFGYYDKDQYDKAVPLLQALANEGHARAQQNLGWCYGTGNGVAKDLAKAIEWYRKSAEQGYAYAQYNLGLNYYNGEGVTKDKAKAVEWFSKAAEQGHAGAQNYLGYCYDEGEGVKKNQAKAVEWYSKAAEQGNAAAQRNLGIAYTNMDKHTEAAEWYGKSAAQGDRGAQFLLGHYYEEGLGIPKDLDKAKEFYEQAAAQGHEGAKKALAKMNGGGGPNFSSDVSLTKLRNDMIFTNFFFILGVSVFAYWSNGGSVYYHSTLGFLFHVLGCVIISAPMLINRIFLGGGSFKFWQDYEVVTTYSDGSKSSDYGAQANATNLIILVIMVFVGVAIQAVKLVFLPIRYAVAYFKEEDKPSFITSGFTVLIAAIALFIICPQFAGHSGKVAYDKRDEKAYNSKLNYSAAPVSGEMRAMLEAEKQKYTASFIDYKMNFGDGYFTISHNGDENTTTVDISKGKLPANYLAGVYYFKNGVFDRFEDTYNTKRTPNAAQIEAAQVFTPQGLFDAFLSAPQDDLRFNDKEDQYLSLGYIELFRRGVDWKNAILFHLFDDRIELLNNNFPASWIGLRGARFTLTPKVLSGDVQFPFLAKVTGDVYLLSQYGYQVNTAKQGEAITVLGESGGSFNVEYHNIEYFIEDKEKIAFVKSIPGDRPAEFNRETPFDAFLAEDIDATLAVGNDDYSLPAGMKVTVNSSYGQKAYVSLVLDRYGSPQEYPNVQIYWKYLSLNPPVPGSEPQSEIESDEAADEAEEALEETAAESE